MKHETCAQGGRLTAQSYRSCIPSAHPTAHLPPLPFALADADDLGHAAKERAADDRPAHRLGQHHTGSAAGLAPLCRQGDRFRRQSPIPTQLGRKVIDQSKNIPWGTRRCRRSVPVHRAGGRTAARNGEGLNRAMRRVHPASKGAPTGPAPACTVCNDDLVIMVGRIILIKPLREAVGAQGGPPKPKRAGGRGPQDVRPIPP